MSELLYKGKTILTEIAAFQWANLQTNGIMIYTKSGCVGVMKMCVIYIN